jgi:hypothetical protein
MKMSAKAKGRKVVKKKPNPFFSSMSSVKPERDAAPRKMLSPQKRRALATKPI